LTKDELLALPRTAAFPAGELTERLIAETQGPIGWLVFNNPARRNAISVDMWEQIPKVIDRYESDPAVRVIVLRGAGDKAFVSGADISQFERERSGATAVQHYEEIADGAQMRLHAADKPTVAMIRGFCLGAGVNIATACDLRIAAADARFGVPAARVGLGYRVSATRNLVDAVGAAYAREMLITARQFSAAEAGAMGLAQRVVAAAELESFVAERCVEIAANAPLTMRTAKRIIRELLKSPQDFDSAACGNWVRECFDSADYKEGRRAFMEKRKPVFSGR
jgi:enoyl-CoA hydratase/carnithine racemase